MPLPRTAAPPCLKQFLFSGYKKLTKEDRDFCFGSFWLLDEGRPFNVGGLQKGKGLLKGKELLKGNC
jgi:hypothetical protein